MSVRIPLLPFDLFESYQPKSNYRSHWQKDYSPNSRNVVDEIKKTGLFSVSADEVTSSTDDILSLCFRYVDTNVEIQEKFATFLDLERLIGEDIPQTISDFYEKSVLNPNHYRGQCYECAPDMQSEKKGATNCMLKE